MGPAFQGARAGDQDQRPVIAKGQIADMDMSSFDHGVLYINLDCATAASMNEVNSGCGSKGRDFNSG
jgi:hypothetical protein